MSNFYAEYPVSGGVGVASINGLTGDVNLVAGNNITITTLGQDITINATSDSAKANVELDNLSNVAINTALLPDADGAYDLGGAGLVWNQIFGNGIYDTNGNILMDITSATLYNADGEVSVDFFDPTLVNILINLVVDGDISAANLSGTNTGDVTLGTAHGLSLVGQALSLALASTSTTGALSNTDWNTFNSKQASGNYITALTGDGVASGPGSAAFTLATVNSNVGSFGSATQVAGFTVNAKGLITAASNTSIQIAESQVTNLVSDLAAKQSTTLSSAHILVGNVSNVATDVAMTGDISITNAGVTAIGANKVTLGMQATLVANTAIANATGSTATPTAVPMTTTNTASAIAMRDSSKNLLTNNLLADYTTTATAAGTTTLTVASTFQQFFTGSTTQTVVLPVASTLTLGHTFFFANKSSGIVTVQSSGANTVQAMAAGSDMEVTCILASGTNAASWNVFYNPASSGIIPIAGGGTGQATKAAAFDALSPMTTAYDIIYGGVSGTGTRLPLGGASKSLQVNSAGTALLYDVQAYPTLNMVKATSATKTSTASANFNQMTGNSITLTAGYWRINGNCLFTQGGSAANYTYAGWGIFGSNGADSGVVPTLLGVTANVNVMSDFQVDSGMSVVQTSSTTFAACILTLPEIIIQATATVTLYAVPYGQMTTAANSRFTVSVNAVKMFTT